MDRTTPLGDGRRLTPVDRFGIWLSLRRIHATVGDARGRRLGDFGCGYHVGIGRSFLAEAAHLTVVDLALPPDLKHHPKVTAIEGRLPDALEGLADASLDVVICNSVLEHLWTPLATLQAFHRLLVPGGLCVINVPSWRGKRFLELSAFELGLSTDDEMDDHKTYYDPRDLWPLLVQAGFRPRHIDCHRYKFGLNTFAACRKGPDAR